MSTERLRFDDDVGGFLLLKKAVELGSLVAAARFLGRDGTWVALRVRHLEARLGVRLLERTTRRLRPTTAGLAYLEHYAPIHAQVMAARALLRGNPLPAGAPVPAATAAAPTSSAAPAADVAAGAALPAHLDLTLRRLDGGQWAAVCFQQELVRTGSGPAEVLHRLAADLR
jgi:DNA-binding transcriptional LysR family regulator